jgi:hypothetical protein
LLKPKRQYGRKCGKTSRQIKAVTFREPTQIDLEESIDLPQEKAYSAAVSNHSDSSFVTIPTEPINPAEVQPKTTPLRSSPPLGTMENYSDSQKASDRLEAESRYQTQKELMPIVETDSQIEMLRPLSSPATERNNTTEDVVLVPSSPCGKSSGSLSCRPTYYEVESISLAGTDATKLERGHYVPPSQATTASILSSPVQQITPRHAKYSQLHGSPNNKQQSVASPLQTEVRGNVPSSPNEAMRTNIESPSKQGANTLSTQYGRRWYNPMTESQMLPASLMNFELPKMGRVFGVASSQDELEEEEV